MPASSHRFPVVFEDLSFSLISLLCLHGGLTPCKGRVGSSARKGFYGSFPPFSLSPFFFLTSVLLLARQWSCQAGLKRRLRQTRARFSPLFGNLCVFDFLLAKTRLPPGELIRWSPWLHDRSRSSFFAGTTLDVAYISSLPSRPLRTRSIRLDEMFFFFFFFFPFFSFFVYVPI